MEEKTRFEKIITCSSKLIKIIAEEDFIPKERPFFHPEDVLIAKAIIAMGED